MEKCKFYEKMLEITEYNLLEKLPDPFLFDDGTRVKTKEDWKKRRKEIYKTAIELQYGEIPPKPEVLKVEPVNFGYPCVYKITTGTEKKQFTFDMYVFKGTGEGKKPSVISGDLCFKYFFDKEYVHTFTDNGINFVAFNRTDLAPDIAAYNLRALDRQSKEYQLARETLDKMEKGDPTGVLKETYPEYSFGTVAAWAWGYSRCVDALEILGFADMEYIAFTGHSRGGKTAALAGALDERAAIVNPNATCAGANGSYRIKIKAKGEEGTEKESEPFSNIYKHFPTWLGSKMRNYIDREELLPFDAHYLKALVAPRVLLVTEASHDIMANPVGSYQTTEAASEVYKFLGCEENLIWHFRSGTHYQTVEDITRLVNVIKHIKNGEPLNEKFFKLPFEELPPAYDFKCPEE